MAFSLRSLEVPTTYHVYVFSYWTTESNPVDSSSHPCIASLPLDSDPIYSLDDGCCGWLTFRGRHVRQMGLIFVLESGCTDQALPKTWPTTTLPNHRICALPFVSRYSITRTYASDGKPSEQVPVHCTGMHIYALSESIPVYQPLPT